MKNIFLLPTDKPSRLYLEDVKFKLTEYDYPNVDYAQNQHIYITNDEEIKEEDWVFGMDGIFQYKGKVNLPDVELPKKIILTTDLELIADGIQAIGNEFLEWFVKNPTCEYAHIGFIAHNDIREYKIIIPQEDPNTNLEKLPFPELVEELANYYKEVPLVEEPKQETLEEVAERLFPFTKDDSENRIITIKRLFWIAGAKWQAERSYSEEEVGELVYNIIGQYANQVNIMIDGSIINGLFEQFKKKA
jgi:hypothetical protein